MAEYKLANGTVITDEDISTESTVYDRGDWEGTLKNIHAGKAPISDEPLVTVPVKFPKSMVDAIDSKDKNRSHFIRKAVAAML